MKNPINSPSPKKEKILIVDDEPFILDVISHILKQEGFQVFCASGGAEGIELFKKIKPDVVLLDLCMPDVNGYEVLEKIKESKIKTRVIVFSGSDSVRNIVKLAKAGACDYIVKPSASKYLVDTIKRALVLENPDNLFNMFYQEQRIKKLIDEIELSDKHKQLFQNKNEELLAEVQKLKITCENLSKKLKKIKDTSIKRKRFRRNKKIFIVHGHDDEIKESITLFVKNLGLHPIILQDQPDCSRTIIEKLEENSSVEYAIILMSPDDIGKEKNCPTRVKYRARQNVILELGYFIGLLSRRRVCIIQKGACEIPSDYAGVLYIKYDKSELWKSKLCKELRHCGYNLETKK